MAKNSRKGLSKTWYNKMTPAQKKLFYWSKKYKRYYRKKYQSKGPLTKAAEKQVKAIVDKKIDKAIEDKYKLDDDYTDHRDQYDEDDQSFVFNVSPVISKGTDVDDRTGDKVTLKYLRTFFRFLPGKDAAFGVVDSSSPVYSRNWLADKPDVHVYLVKVTSQMIEDMSADELREACAVKFRRFNKGTCWQDEAQAYGNTAVTAIKLLKHFTIKPRFRNIIVPNTDLTQTGTVSLPTSIMDGEITLTPTYSPSVVSMNIPQYSNYDLYCKEVAQKVTMDASSDAPIKSQYWYYVQMSNAFNDNSYNPVIKPTKFEIRNCWVFEDA